MTKQGGDMTREEFRAALDAMNIGQTAFARSLGVNPRTVRRWALGAQAVPRYVALILALLKALEDALGEGAADKAMRQ